MCINCFLPVIMRLKLLINLFTSIQDSVVVCEKIVGGNVEHLKRLSHLNHPKLSRIELLEFPDAHLEIVSNLTIASDVLTFITKKKI